MATINSGILAEALHGKVGSAVFTRTASGTVVRPRTIPRNPRTRAQTAIRANLARAVAAYRTLSTTQFAAWQAYASRQVRVDLRDGTARHPTAYAAFVGLAAKFLQVSPASAIPLNPPAFDFIGDRITLTVSTTPGKIKFTASAANTASTKTELLLQPLRFGHQAPKSRGYRTQTFAAFAAGSLSLTLNVKPGWYAAAYRFVNSQTGQETGLMVLPAAVVG